MSRPVRHGNRRELVRRNSLRFMRIVADDKISDTIFAFKRGTSNRRYIMKKIVRGSAISLLMSLFVVFMYAQAPAGSTITVARDLQPKLENKINHTVVN